ncbi:unnamed protein product [Lasius platythorax]|uniref:Uncharacterized protein n=1 Tax=Lasius platythorax TaxID=488582 RepID=A0AAV2N8F7_9HYME
MTRRHFGSGYWGNLKATENSFGMPSARVGTIIIIVSRGTMKLRS